MPFAVLVRLRNGRYDAAGLRPDEAEWPPHPARVFCALTASAPDEAERAALRWLESLPAPEVWAAAEASATARSGYVVTNVRHSGPKGFSQSWPARTSGTRNRVGVIHVCDGFAIVWPDAEPGAAHIAALRRLARRVPYVGRSTSPSSVSVQAALPARDSRWSSWRPTAADGPGRARLRIPCPGFLDQLEEAYTDGRRAWEVRAQVVAYTPDDQQAPAARVGALGPYTDLLVFGFDRGAAALHGRSLLSLTVTLRRALMTRIATAIPAPVSGHGADDRAHVAYLALPDVGHEHADGHLLGVALGLPATMTEAELSRVLEASIDDPLRRLTVRGDYKIGVTYRSFGSSPWGLATERWTAADRGGSRYWVTATPLMLDRHPHGTSTVISEIAWSLCRAGYPEPKEVEVSPAALLTGAVHRVDLTAIPERGPRRPLYHARVTFPEAVIGPVIAGALKYFGAGLFAPVKDGQ